ncbi:MAG TPA: hypothetical protein VFP68_13260 [Burkholderiaceae bacterium]|nr:hypothetical protein [Burkholderiaceae bacterium]
MQVTLEFMGGMSLITAGIVALSRARSMLAFGDADARDACIEALDIVSGLPDTVDMTNEIGPHGQRVADHIQDYSQGRPRSRARQAIEAAGNDPQQIVRNLLQLITADPPVLSRRLTSSPVSSARRQART